MDEQNISGKKNIDKSKLKKVTVIVLICCILLIIGVAVTSAVLGDRLDDISENDEGVISIVPDADVIEEDVENDTDKNADNLSGDEANVNTGDEETEGETSNDSQSQRTETVPSDENNGSFVPNSNGKTVFGFEAADGQKVWTTNTNVEIFRCSYDDGSGNISVASSNGDQVIAPGTEGSYTFKFKNTGNMPVTYDMNVKVALEPAGIELPITFKLNRYDGSYLAGSEKNWVEADKLHGLTDSAELQESSYVYYTLEWKWPFESGNDEYDTLLGDISLEQDITLGMTIETVATGDWVETEVIDGPKTGDNARWGTYILLLGASALVIFLIIFFRRRKDEEEEDEA